MTTPVPHVLVKILLLVPVVKMDGSLLSKASMALLDVSPVIPHARRALDQEIKAVLLVRLVKKPIPIMVWPTSKDTTMPVLLLPELLFVWPNVKTMTPPRGEIRVITPVNLAQTDVLPVLPTPTVSHVNLKDSR